MKTSMVARLALVSGGAVALVLMQGSDGGCGAAPPISVCTQSATRVFVLDPGQCAPVPSCDGATRYAFPDSTYTVDASAVTTTWLAFDFARVGLDDPLKYVEVCATADAPRGATATATVTMINVVSAKATPIDLPLTVRVRGEPKLRVNLSVDGAPVVDGRTLLGTGVAAPVRAGLASFGSLLGVAGTWNLDTSTDSLQVKSATTGVGSLMPLVRGDAQLTLSLMNGDSDGKTLGDVFSLPVRILGDGDHALIYQKAEVYHGEPCPWDTFPSSCNGLTACFNLRQSIVSWPIRVANVSLTAFKEGVEVPGGARGGVEFRVCESDVDEVGIVFHGPSGSGLRFEERIRVRPGT